MTTGARDPEFYLSHANYVRALARRLMYDAHAADDLFQDAWLAALERPPRDGSTPRRWLRVIVKNLASTAWLSGDRRRAREELAARPETSSSPDEVLAHESERRRVVQALLELEEPYRATLIRRFYDGLEPREIAAREGVSIETVRTRHKRALAQLRRKLESERPLGGWLVASLNLGAPSWPAALRHLAKGALLVSSVKKVAIAAALIALVWLGARAIDGALAPAPDASALAPAAALEAPADAPGALPVAAGERDAVASAPAGPAAAPGASATTGELVARITWASDGAPAVDVAARAIPFPTQNSALTEREARTDREGVVRFAGLPPGRAQLVLDRGVDALVEIGAGQRTEIALAIPAGARVRGRVIDADRRPVANARVVLCVDRGWEYHGAVVARSDADGAFAVRDVPAGSELAFSALADLRAPTPQRLVRAALGEELEIELAFEAAGGALRGTVVDAAGAPIAHAAVMVGYDFDFRRAKASGGPYAVPLSSQRAFTDEHGEYRIESLAAGPTPIAIGARGFATYVGRVEIERDRETRLDATLERGTRLEGVVTDERGAPAAGATVRVGMLGLASAYAQAAADGTYALEGLPIGEFQVHAELEGRGEASQKLVGAVGATLRWDARLARDVTLHVQIVAPGRELGGWTIQTNAMNYTESNYARNVTTDARGVAELTNCPDALLRIMVASPSSGYFLVATLEDVDPRSGTVTIEADPKREPSARVAGRVVDGAGSPIAGAEVTLMPTPLDAGGASATTDADGRFLSSALPPRMWRLIVRADGFASGLTGSRPIAADATTEWGDVVLERGGSLAVHVTADAGIDLASVQVSLLEQDMSLGIARVTDGTARFDAIAGGAYRLTAYGDRVAIGMSEIRVRDGAETRAELHVTQGVEVTVAIVDDHGRDVAERVEGRLEDLAGGVLDSGPTLPWTDGTRWVRRLAPGKYRLQLSDHRDRKCTLEIEIDAANLAPRVLSAMLR